MTFLDRRICYNCDDPMYAHDEKFGCCAERVVEVNGERELTSCDCFDPRVSDPYEPVLAPSVVRRETINGIVDSLGVTRAQAEDIVKRANREGYNLG